MLFLPKAHSTEQTPFTRALPSSTQLTAESTEAMRIKCLAQGHNIMMLPGFEPSIAVSRNGYLTNMTNDRKAALDCVHNALSLTKYSYELTG